MKIPRVRGLLIFAHAFLFIGLLPYLVNFILVLVQATHSPYAKFFWGLYIPLPPIFLVLNHLVLFTATPLYIIALWADKTDKYLNPKYRWVCWLCAFVPIMVIGFLVWAYIFPLLKH